MSAGVVGLSAAPRVDGWGDLVPASAMQNHVLGDSLLDWLDLHGEACGFERDLVDVRTDFDFFVMRKGREFERAVLNHLAGLGVGEVRQVVHDDASSAGRLSDAAVEATLEAMRDRVPIVAKGALLHAESRTFGFPDLLLRSDVLMGLFPDALAAAAAAAPAPGLGLGNCHYVVVDVKFMTLHLLAGGGLNNSRSNPAYKVQLFVYNRALGALQGHLPPYAYLLGRGWEQTKKGEKRRVGNCMDRLAPVKHDDTIPGGTLPERAAAASAWVRRVHCEGRDWAVVPEPSVPELRPNAEGEHGPWKSAVNQIVAGSEDLTGLWNVGASKRDQANAKGLTRWTDPAVSPAALGVTGPKTGRTLQALLNVNRGIGPDVQPERIGTLRADWHQPAEVEFYVDFETVSDLDDDFSAIPERGGQPLIFMIGCGHIENGEWRFTCFTADDLSKASEAIVIEAWFDHMAHVSARLSPNSTPRVFHWSKHEVSSLESALDDAATRHPVATGRWPEPEWFDFLAQVVRAEPVVVRGAHGFGLKEITNALSDLCHIDISWDTGPADGRGAMVGAWWCQHQLDIAAAQRLPDLPLMREIEAYNEVDCKAMMAIISHLRENH